MSVLVFIDGVLRKKADQSLLIDGANFYKALNESYRVLIVTDDKEKTDIWLKKNNLTKKIDDILQIEKSPLGNDDLRAVEKERTRGPIDFVVTDNPNLASKLLEIGIMSVVMLSPFYTRPEFRPDAREGVKSWEKITEELDKQQGVYIEDKRLSSQDDFLVEE